MGDIPLGVEDRVVRCGKIDLCANLEDVRLDLNHLKIRLGSRLFFERNFGGFWVLGRSPEITGELATWAG